MTVFRQICKSVKLLRWFWDSFDCFRWLLNTFLAILQVNFNIFQSLSRYFFLKLWTLDIFLRLLHSPWKAYTTHFDILRRFYARAKNISYCKTVFAKHFSIVRVEIFALQSLATFATTKAICMIWFARFLWSDGFVLDNFTTLGAIFQELLQSKSQHWDI